MATKRSTKEIGYAYPSSPRAKKLGHAKLGTLYVESPVGIRVFKTMREARAYANKLPYAYDKYSMPDGADGVRSNPIEFVAEKGRKATLMGVWKRFNRVGDGAIRGGKHHVFLAKTGKTIVLEDLTDAQLHELAHSLGVLKPGARSNPKKRSKIFTKGYEVSYGDSDDASTIRFEGRYATKIAAKAGERRIIKKIGNGQLPLHYAVWIDPFDSHSARTNAQSNPRESETKMKKRSNPGAGGKPPASVVALAKSRSLKEGAPVGVYRRDSAWKISPVSHTIMQDPGSPYIVVTKGKIDTKATRMMAKWETDMKHSARSNPTAAKPRIITQKGRRLRGSCTVAQASHFLLQRKEALSKLTAAELATHAKLPRAARQRFETKHGIPGRSKYCTPESAEYVLQRGGHKAARRKGPAKKAAPKPRFDTLGRQRKGSLVDWFW